MKKSALALALLAFPAAVSMLGLLGCHRVSNGNAAPDRIVGAWFVTDTAAPFHYHMYVFNADGTMQQANPDAGDPNTSDSDGKGVWVSDGQRIKGKFVEVTADRVSHQFVSRGEISYELMVNGDNFAGTAAARFYDVKGGLVQGPINTSLAGKRVTLP
jgi:hypothetical protein